MLTDVADEIIEYSDFAKRYGICFELVSVIIYPLKSIALFAYTAILSVPLEKYPITHAFRPAFTFYKITAPK